MPFVNLKPKICGRISEALLVEAMENATFNVYVTRSQQTKYFAGEFKLHFKVKKNELMDECIKLDSASIPLLFAEDLRKSQEGLPGT